MRPSYSILSLSLSLSRTQTHIKIKPKAPKSSASYSPELPSLVRSIDGQSVELSNLDDQQQLGSEATSSALQSEPPDGVVGISESYSNRVDKSNSALPSIDYTEYFANFDSRPIHQTLPINLELNNKHFMVSLNQSHQQIENSVTESNANHPFCLPLQDFRFQAQIEVQLNSSSCYSI